MQITSSIRLGAGGSMHVLPISKAPMQQSMQLQPGLSQALSKAQNQCKQQLVISIHREKTPTNRGGREGGDLQSNT
jgi:hypothetical protein